MTPQTLADRAFEGLTTHIYWLVLAGLAFCCAVYFMPPLDRIFLPLTLGYNEGWNALHAERLFSGAALYPDKEDLIVNNYTPLSFYIVGAVGAATGDMVIAGRLVALAALIITAAAMGLFVKRATEGWAPAAVATAVILAIFGGQYQVYVAYNDPQLIGHALMALGLLALTGGQRTTGSIVLASGLMILGGLAKHMLLPLPIAATLWLFFADRRAFRTWMIASVGFAVGALALCYVLYGASFFSSVIGYSRGVSIYRLVDSTSMLLVLAPIAAFSLAAFFEPFKKLEAVRLPAIATLVAALWSLVTSSGEGVGENAFFDVLFYGVPVAVILADRYVRDAAPAAKTALAVVLWAAILTPAVTPFGPQTIAALKWTDQRGPETAAAEALIADIRAIDGPVACSRLVYCYWAGKGFEMDFFSLGQLASADAEFAAYLNAALARKDFAAIQVRPGFTENYPPVGVFIDAHYDVAKAYPFHGALMRPGG